MGELCKILIICLYIQACYGDPEDAPSQGNTTPPCVVCPKKTTTHRTTTHSTLHTTHKSTLHTTVTHPTTHTKHTTTPHPTTHTNHTTTPHPTTQTKHTTTPHPTTHTNHTTPPHPTTHTNHTTTPHPTTHTKHTTTPHPTTHTTSPHPTTHTNHTTTPHPTKHTTSPHPTTHTNHTTRHANHTSTPTAHPNTTHLTTTPTPTVPPTEYVVNGTTGVCLRIKASFNISFSDKKKSGIVIPPPPSTRASGNCSAEKAWLALTFPDGQVAITFKQDTEGNNFFLAAVNITLKDKEPERFDNSSLKDMVTPLGRAFSCGEVDINVTSKVTFSIMNVMAQAFKLEGGKYGREMKCSDGSHSMTVPIVVGVILVVLILTVVIAYLVARRRSHGGYQPL